MEKIVLKRSLKKDLAFTGKLLGNAEILIHPNKTKYHYSIYQVESGKLVCHSKSPNEHQSCKIYGDIDELQKEYGFSEQWKNFYAKCGFDITEELT